MKAMNIVANNLRHQTSVWGEQIKKRAGKNARSGDDYLQAHDSIM